MPARNLTETEKQQASLLWFSEIDSADLALAGGKGANLGEMSQRGAPVPPGFVVSVVSYQRFLTDNGLDALIRAILDNLNVHNSGELVAAAAKAQNAINSAPLKPMPFVTCRASDGLLSELPRHANMPTYSMWRRSQDALVALAG